MGNEMTIDGSSRREWEPQLHVLEVWTDNLDYTTQYRHLRI